MISYYPGDLPQITGNPDDIFLCDPIKEAASEYLQSEAKRRKEIIAQIEKADAITYVRQLRSGRAGCVFEDCLCSRRYFCLHP